MGINIEYIDQIVVDSRKMRTTRGPGFTTLKVSFKAAVSDDTMPSHPWPSMTPALSNATLPAAMKDLGADKTELHWGYWYRDASDVLSCAFSIHITFEDRGHAKRADAARLILKRLRKEQVEATFLRTLMEQVFEATRAERAREEACQQLSWMAAGIAEEARRKAMEATHFKDKLASLRRTLANYTENEAIDMVSVVSREHGVDEAELKLAVEKVLSEPTHYIGRY